jgi:hypothetical protein
MTTSQPIDAGIEVRFAERQAPELAWRPLLSEPPPLGNASLAAAKRPTGRHRRNSFVTSKAAPPPGRHRERLEAACGTTRA